LRRDAASAAAGRHARARVLDQSAQHLRRRGAASRRAAARSEDRVLRLDALDLRERAVAGLDVGARVAEQSHAAQSAGTPGCARAGRAGSRGRSLRVHRSARLAAAAHVRQVGAPAPNESSIQPPGVGTEMPISLSSHRNRIGIGLPSRRA
jgi:hypothetical protein